MNNYPPTAYQMAAEKARAAGDRKAASRLEHSGSAECLGHGRAERHEQRAKEDWPEFLGYATEEDLKLYM